MRAGSGCVPGTAGSDLVGGLLDTDDMLGEKLYPAGNAHPLSGGPHALSHGDLLWGQRAGIGRLQTWSMVRRISEGFTIQLRHGLSLDCR
jgi:hypothetical protein